MNITYRISNYNIVPLSNIDMQIVSETVVYEVVRIIDYTPLFYHEHMERMFNSCQKIGCKVNIDSRLLLQRISELAMLETKSTGNVMIKIAFSNESHELSAQFIPHKYPSENDYQNGVEVGFLHAERVNPEAKTVQPAVRDIANKLIAETDVYEVLLVNNQLEITEGSRSNFFCIKGDSLITTPPEKVLMGITMVKTIEIAKKLGVHVIYCPIMKIDIANFDSMFLTGTSPKILPVSKAGNYCFDVKTTILKQLINEYDLLISGHLS